MGGRGTSPKMGEWRPVVSNLEEPLSCLETGWLIVPNKLRPTYQHGFLVAAHLETGQKESHLVGNMDWSDPAFIYSLSFFWGRGNAAPLIDQQVLTQARHL